MIEVKAYTKATGAEPIGEWLKSIKDTKTKSIIMKSLTKLQTGLIGNTAPVGEGVMEIKIHYSEGYRIYYAYHNNELIILLCGGSKSSQKRDIARAKEYWKEHMSRYAEREIKDEKHKRNSSRRTQKK